MKSSNKSIPKLGKSFKRTFLGDDYRTKKEVLNAFNSSTNSLDQLKSVVEHKNYIIKKINSDIETLTDKLNSSSVCNYSLKQALTTEQTELDKFKRLYTLSDEEVKRQREEIIDLHSDLNTFKEDYKLLEDTVNDLKSPLSTDVLRNLVYGAVDENYAKIKEKLVDFVVNTQVGVINEYGDDARNFREELDNLGFAIHHDMTPIKVDFEKYSENKNDLISANFSFDNPELYTSEHDKGFEQAKFYDKNSDLKLVIVNYFNPDNVFSDNLLADRVDFAKAALWGETVKFLNDKDYTSSAKLIANNGLHDLALSYISKNKDDSALLANMKPVLDSYK